LLARVPHKKINKKRSLKCKTKIIKSRTKKIHRAKDKSKNRPIKKWLNNNKKERNNYKNCNKKE
jgi:hypothetical protein